MSILQQYRLFRSVNLMQLARFPETRPLRFSVARVVSLLTWTPWRGSPTHQLVAEKITRICLFGFFGGGNFGNDGSLEAMLLILRHAWPLAELACVCPHPQKIARDHQVATIGISWERLSNPVIRACNKLALRGPGMLANWVRTIQYVRKFDMLIVTGTSTLCDYRATSFDTPYALFRWAIAARLCGTKLCFVRTGAGPIQRPLTRWMLKGVAALADYRSFRDEVSRKYCASIGIDTSGDRVYPDLVFQLPTPPGKASAGSPDRPITIGVGVMDYCGWQHVTAEQKNNSPSYRAYLSIMSTFILSLLERGFIVRLLIGEVADQRAVTDLERSMEKKGYRLTTSSPSRAEPGQLIAEPIRSLRDVMHQIAQTDIVVASRYHNVVCALKFARPTVSIGYEKKNAAVMATMGLAGFCQDIDELDLTRLNLQFDKLLNNKSFYEQQTRRRLDEIQRSMGVEEELLNLGLVAGVGLG